MFVWIDELARIAGYGTIIGVIIWFLGSWAEHRSTVRAAVIERASLEKLRVERPELYEKELWWRDNDRRLKMGLPTDPEYTERIKAIVQNAWENDSI